MAANIAAVACDLVHGDVPVDLDEQTKRWHTPGVNGEGILLLGQAGVPFQLQAVKYDTKANVDTWAEDIKGHEGELVNIENDWGQTMEVFLERVSVPKKTAVKIPGSNHDCRGEVTCTCVLVESP